MRIHEFLNSLGKKRSLGFRAWQFVILFLRSITLLAFAWVGLQVKRGYDTRSLSECIPSAPVEQALTVFAVAEVLFFAYYRRVRARLQRLKPLPHRCQTPAARRKLVEQCVRAVRPAPAGSTEKPSPYLRAAIERWFLGAPLERITRADFAQWCAWAFFNQELARLDAAHATELNALLLWFQKEVHWTFPDKTAADQVGGVGSQRTPPPKSIRLSLDPVLDTQRPLIYYAAISAINAVGLASVRALGFRRRRCGGGPGVASLSVMYRPAAAAPGEDEGRAVVFVHGIGIGFAHYLLLLARLPTASACYLVEWPHVCMQVVEDVAPVDATVAALAGLLRADGHGDDGGEGGGGGATFVGHSLGSTCVAWMLHDPAARRLVKAAVLLDPVTFLLMDPGIAYNFLHRPPTSVLELLMHYFVSRELFIAHTLSRHFSWSHNVLFPETDLPPNPGLSASNGAGDRALPPTVVVLSGHDAIVPARETADYLARSAAALQAEGGGGAHSRGGGAPRFEVVWLDCAQHGEMCLRADHLAMVEAKVRERCPPRPRRAPKASE